MFQTYLKLAYRNLLANKVVSVINIVGLSIAIGASIAVYLFLRNLMTADNFHANAAHIYMAEYTVENEGVTEVWGDSPVPLGPALAERFPQVERAVRVENEWVKVYSGDDVLNELVSFVDNGYLDMFTFPLEHGSPAALTQPNTVIISHGAAERLFPNENPMGKTLTVSSGLLEKKVLTIGGVAKKFPDNTGLKFSLLAGYDQLPSFGFAKQNDWAAMTRATFVQLKPGAEVAILEKGMAAFVAQQNAANPDLQVKSFLLDNLKNPRLKAYEVIRRPIEALHPLAYVAFGGIALLMFALSCFNYINIALGQASKRLKEIGVRKVVGGRKWELVGQFMSENLLLCLIAMVGGLVLTKVALVPFFNATFAEKITLDLQSGAGIWLFLLGLLAFTGIVSGAYPALYISSFETVSIFKGKSDFSTKSKLTKVFLCLQFVLAFSAVMLGVLVTSMASYWKDLPWGYQPEQTLVVRLDEPGQFDKLRNEALQNPNVKHIGSAVSHIGEGMDMVDAKVAGKDERMVRYQVGLGYFEAMGLGLTQGRFFDAQRRSEDELSIVVNQAFLKENEIKSPLGQQVYLEGKNYNVVGVMSDFNIAGTAAQRSVAFFLAPESDLAYLVLRCEPRTLPKVEASMKAAWGKLGTTVPYLAFHQAEVFEAEYQAYDNLSTAFRYIAGLALLIACMGLFGLASQNYAARLKESGIRKVLGASAQQIILRANRSFIALLLVASVIATGLCFGGFQFFIKMAEDFTGKVSLGAWPYLLSNLLVFAVAAIAVAWQSVKLARVEPAETLRSE
ncbi:MAG: ABC transporter permease [Saprospiraceae bacterium]|nr:ABC transporter permease [Saprospiraceae bacterium]